MRPFLSAAFVAHAVNVCLLVGYVSSSAVIAAPPKKASVTQSNQSSIPEDHQTESSLGTWCDTVFDTIERGKPEDFRFPKQLGSDSVIATSMTSSMTLTLAQIIRYLTTQSPDAQLFTQTFGVTLASDVLITIASVWIGLGNIPGAQDYFESHPRTEYAARSFMSAALSTTGIAATWAMAGVPVTGETVCGAAALCAAVYPILQSMRTFLFKTMPTHFDQKIADSLDEEHLVPFYELRHRALKQASESGIPHDKAEAMLLAFLDSSAMALPYESRIEWTKHYEPFPDIKKLIASIHKERTRDPYSSQVRKLRRQLVDRILDLRETSKFSSQTTAIEILRLHPTHSDEFTIAFHKLLSKRSGRYWYRLFGASVIDQAISVGVAGGVFLYGVNHWAQTGELPWFACMFGTHP